MTKLARILRYLLAPNACCAALFFSSASFAQKLTGELRSDDHPHVSTESISEFNSYTFESTVLQATGVPAIGAVVISSSGSQAITNADGEFQLDVRVPSGTKSLQVTAVGSGSANFVATKPVSLPALSARIKLDALKLASTSSCSPSWLPTFGNQQGVIGTVKALTVFDDGTGAALFVGGFLIEAGGAPVASVAKWQNDRWFPVGSGLGSGVEALAVYDDGNGPALFAAGSFLTGGGGTASRIAKWDGTSWSGLNGGGVFGGITIQRVNALQVFDDGSGEELFVAGEFSIAGNVSAKNIAKWDGSSWSPLGSGTASVVEALAVYDDGTGSALYVGGRFTSAGGVPANRIAKWNGSDWSALGSGTDTTILSLTVFDNGNGPELVAAGDFLLAGGIAANRIASWDGANWSALANGLDLTVEALTVYDDGLGSALYAGGLFENANGVAANRVAKWDGSSWSSLESGITGFGTTSVNALEVFDDGDGPKLYGGGTFFTAGSLSASNIAAWDGFKWSVLGTGLNSSVNTLTVYDSGEGPELYAGGDFTTIGSESHSRIAKWDGTNWLDVGSGAAGPFVTRVNALATFDDGNGSQLYMGGLFTSVSGIPAQFLARYNGTSWFSVGNNANNSGPTAFAVFDDGSGSALFATGAFTEIGGVLADRIAKWDGTTWTPLGSGLNNVGSSLTVFDDGTGEALFVGGEFTTAGGIPATRVAKWDGANWFSTGSSFNDCVDALVGYDDGNSAALYAGGRFNTVVSDGIIARRIAKWDGTVWTSVGSGFNSTVTDLKVFDDGTGSALFATGGFTTTDGVAANSIAKWNGSSWAALNGGLESQIASSGFGKALTIFDDGKGAALFAGGEFEYSNDSGDSYLAKWGCDNSPTLTGDAERISLMSGGQQSLNLDAGASCANWFYFMLGSATGTAPGINFGNDVQLPLNLDAYLLLTLNKPGFGVFGNFRGTLDGNGLAQATFTIPARSDPAFAGLTLNHAFLAANVLGFPEFASNAVQVTLIP